MPAEDALMTRLAQREVSRRYVDSTRLSIMAYHGTIYLRGQIRTLRGHDLDLNQELETIGRILRSRPGVRDVVMEVETKN